MKLFASLDAQDRKLLLYCIGAVGLLAVLIAVFARNQNKDDNPLPSSYLTGKHGASAAYELLQANGYSIERWEQPLSDLAARANAQTVVILAEPSLSGAADFKAIKEILQRGGRVVATGFGGGLLVPDGAARPSSQLQMAACKLTPQGLDGLANSGEVWMVPEAGWQVGNPAFHVDYTCGGQPAVVEFDWASGHAVW